MKNGRNLLFFAIGVAALVWTVGLPGDDDASGGAVPTLRRDLPEDAVVIISTGERVDVFGYLEPGRRTVIEFTGDFCEGSRQFADLLDKALLKHHDLYVRTVDIGQWGSDVAAQYGITKLPEAWLYDGEDLVTEDYREVLRILDP